MRSIVLIWVIMVHSFCLYAEEWNVIKNLERTSFKNLQVWENESFLWVVDQSNILKISIDLKSVLEEWTHQMSYVEGVCCMNDILYFYDGYEVKKWVDGKFYRLFEFIKSHLKDMKVDDQYIYLLFNSKIVRWQHSNRKYEEISIRKKMDCMTIISGRLFLANEKEVVYLNERSLSLDNIFKREVYQEADEQLKEDEVNLIQGNNHLLWQVGSEFFCIKKNGKLIKNFKAKVDEITGGIKSQQGTFIQGSYFVTVKGQLMRVNIKDGICRAVQGLPFMNVYQIGEARKNLTVVSERGVWIKEEGSKNLDKDSCQKEPSFQEVMERVIDYQGLKLEEVKKWQNKIKKRAYYPQVSLSFNYEQNELNEIYTSSTKSFLYEADPEHEFSTTIRLTWDLADSVFPTDDIVSWDTRKRLNVQLREDILLEVSRIYHQRKKLIVEVKTQEKKYSVKKLLLIEELTSLLDIYTGAWFSQQCSKKH